MKALKSVLLVVMLLGLGMMLTGCNEGHSRNDKMMMGDSRMEMDRVGWEQGLSGFPHPVVLHP
jgi:uncharacterized lipoprotein YehR (DUF1307 family)